MEITWNSRLAIHSSNKIYVSYIYVYVYIHVYIYDEHKFILLDYEKNNVSKQVVFKFQFKE